MDLTSSAGESTGVCHTQENEAVSTFDLAFPEFGPCVVIIQERPRAHEIHIAGKFAAELCEELRARTLFFCTDGAVKRASPPQVEGPAGDRSLGSAPG